MCLKTGLKTARWQEKKHFFKEAQKPSDAEFLDRGGARAEEKKNLQEIHRKPGGELRIVFSLHRQTYLDNGTLILYHSKSGVSFQRQGEGKRCVCWNSSVGRAADS